MRIDVLDSAEAVAQARESWEEVYTSDPEAQFFLSWTWTWNSVTASSGAWLVLAARPSNDASNYVAFLPIRIKTERREHSFFNEVALGPIRLADYQGLICTPAFEEIAIPALAEHIKKFHWTNLVLENFTASDRRIKLFLKPYQQDDFIIRELLSSNMADTVNLSLCPYVDLPESWEAYLSNDLSSNTRQKVKRFLKKVDEAGEFRITHADRSTIKRHLNILMDLWAAKWGNRKGDQTNTIVKTSFIMLLRCFESNSLFLPVLWKGDMPLGALACLTDRAKGRLLFHTAGRDETFTSPPPGIILHAYTICYAIRQGFRTYDFMRGNEPYKYMLGAKERRIRSFVISTRNGRNLGDKLDHRSLAHALRDTAVLHRNGRLGEAEHGYHQILEADPHHTMALYCLGQLLAAKGSHDTATETFKTLLTLDPRSHKGWFRMGKSLRMQGDIGGAAICCRRAVELEPEYSDALTLLSEISSSVDDLVGPCP